MRSHGQFIIIDFAKEHLPAEGLHEPGANPESHDNCRRHANPQAMRHPVSRVNCIYLHIPIAVLESVLAQFHMNVVFVVSPLHSSRKAEILDTDTVIRADTDGVRNDAASLKVGQFHDAVCVAHDVSYNIALK
jgi:hypothetical protein